jgi:hypothetical protein
MTTAECMTYLAGKGYDVVLVDEVGAALEKDDDAAPLTPEDRALFREHRDRLAAILTLRRIHTLMGYSPEDVLFIERALLSDRALEVRMMPLPPAGVTA